MQRFGGGSNFDFVKQSIDSSSSSSEECHHALGLKAHKLINLLKDHIRDMQDLVDCCVDLLDKVVQIQQNNTRTVLNNACVTSDENTASFMFGYSKDWYDWIKYTT